MSLISKAFAPDSISARDRACASTSSVKHRSLYSWSRHLSALPPDQLVTTVEKFYVRTCASEVVDTRKSWKIKMDGLVQEHLNLTSDELQENAKPMGMHLMECSGNTRATQFALLSVADWVGVPISGLLATRVKPRTDREQTR